MQAHSSCWQRSGFSVDLRQVRTFLRFQTLIVNQQRNRRARLPHVWHLLRPRARSFLSLLLEQLPYCKFPWSLNIAHHLTTSTASQTTECYNICLKIQIFITFSLRSKLEAFFLSGCWLCFSTCSYKCLRWRSERFSTGISSNPM